MNLNSDLFEDWFVDFPELPDEPLTTFSFPNTDLPLAATISPPIFNTKNMLSSGGVSFPSIENGSYFTRRSYFQRADPNQITKSEIYSNFTERELDDPFNEIEPLTLQRLRIDCGQPLLATGKRIELSGAKPLLYYDAIRSPSHTNSTKDVVVITDPQVDWVHGLTLELSRSSAIATGNIQISKLYHGPFLVNSYRGDKQLFSFTATGITYFKGSARAGLSVFVAPEEIILDILPFLQRSEDNEPTSVYCSFQSHPGCINTYDLAEVFYITNFHK